METAGRQDITDTDIIIDALEEAMYPEGRDVYDGPGAYTAADMVELFGVTENAVRERARRATARGKLVRVQISNDSSVGGHPTVAAWVPTQIYNEWKDNDDGHAGSEK